MTNSAPTKNTTAFFAMAGISFAVSLIALMFAILYLDTDTWAKAFLAMGVLFLTTSTFTLAKCVRDNEESQSVVHRLDQARVDRLLAEHDPFRAVS
ncbi:YiaA/YiaB family inner membrane protein [Nocardioides sp. GXZ039]|uniref:YiaA/YiaB family inner membrane protein n=1 Tax=Nocardioides sp. GXZ039 TaxID=3136018 RepID=UPI0030F48DF8